MIMMMMVLNDDDTNEYSSTDSHYHSDDHNGYSTGDGNCNNVEYDDDYVSEEIPNTISLHRKKQSNTLYTINALNEVIRELNGGVLDKKFPIPWEDYHNSLLLTNDEGLNKIPTKIHSIVNVKEWEKD